MPLQMLREALEALQERGDLPEAEAARLIAALARLPETQPASPEQLREAATWLIQRGSLQALFGVGGSCWEPFLRALIIGDPADTKALAASLREGLENYLTGGRSLTALVLLCGFGFQYFVWDIEARKRWSKSLEALLTSAGEGDSSAVRRLALLGPVPLRMAPQTATLLWAKLLARDGAFFLELGKALQRNVADRRERRAVGKLEEFLLVGASLLRKGPWSDADLLSLFQRKGIVTERTDPAAFKVRRQRLGVPLRPKGRRPSRSIKHSGSKHPTGRKGS